MSFGNCLHEEVDQFLESFPDPDIYDKIDFSNVDYADYADILTHIQEFLEIESHHFFNTTLTTCMNQGLA